MNKVMIVAKREYLAVVKKKSFWLSTLLLPALILLVSLLNSFSAEKVQEKFEETHKFDKENVLMIYDETGLIEGIIPPTEGINFVNAIEEGRDAVINDEAKVFFHYPAEIVDGAGKIYIYRENLNVIENSEFNATATSLLRDSVVSTLDPVQSKIINTPPSVELKVYEGDRQVEERIEDYIVPIGAFVIYFLMISFGMSYLLASLAEEKESRMMEIILTSIRSDDLIKGKLIGLIGIVLTQIFLLVFLAIAGFMITDASLPIDLGRLTIDYGQLALSLIYAFLGFAILANVMVGVGAAMPTLKEAQSFSSVFIMMAVMPLYALGFLIADPNGTVAQVLSYVPISAPLILLFRNAVGVISPIEIVISLLALFLQLIATYYLALKLFELGALEFGQRLSLDSIKQWYRERKG